MFELALCVNELDVDYLEKKLPSFRENILALGGIFNVSRNVFKVYFLIATENNEKEVKLLVTNFISDCIRECFKKNFILKRLDVECGDDLKKETLLEALINFDRMSDEVFVKSLIKLNGEFHIYSFYMFKLTELKKKWEQLVRVTNQSKVFLKDDEIYLEVIKYLIDGIDMGEEATVEKVNEVYVAKMGDSNILYKIDSSKSLLNYLIKANPKTITVKGVDNKIFHFISQIFGKRVQQG